MANSGKRPNWQLGAASILISCIVLFTLAELLARSAGHGPYQLEGPQLELLPDGHLFERDELLGYRNTSGQYKIIQNGLLEFTATNNSDGHRITSTKPNDSLPACWIFGCSFTYGWGVNDEESFPFQLQQRIPENQIINFGIPGQGIYQNLLALERELPKGRSPRTIVLAYADFHDERNVLSKNFAGVLARFNRLGPLKMPFVRLGEDGSLKRRKPVDLHYNIWPLAQHSAFINAMQRTYVEQTDGQLNAELVSLKLIEEFQGTCSSKGIRFILAYIGDPKKVDSILGYCAQTGIEAIDISIDLSTKGASLLPLDPHPSAISHQEYAERTFEFLKQSY